MMMARMAAVMLVLLSTVLLLLGVHAYGGDVAKAGNSDGTDVGNHYWNVDRTIVYTMMAFMLKMILLFLIMVMVMMFNTDVEYDVGAHNFMSIMMLMLRMVTMMW